MKRIPLNRGTSTLKRSGFKSKPKPMRKRSPNKKKAKSYPLRRAAMGQECTLRLPGSNHNPETVVLCHIRRFNAAGMGEKPPDWFAVFACSYCHDVIDGRRNDVEWSDTDLLRGMFETMTIQEALGNIIVKK